MKRILVATAAAACGAVGLWASPADAHFIDSPGVREFDGDSLFIEVRDHSTGLACAEKVSPVINRPVLEPSVPCFGR